MERDGMGGGARTLLAHGPPTNHHHHSENSRAFSPALLWSCWDPLVFPSKVNPSLCDNAGCRGFFPFRPRLCVGEEEDRSFRCGGTWRRRGILSLPAEPPVCLEGRWRFFSASLSGLGRYSFVSGDDAVKGMECCEGNNISNGAWVCGVGWGVECLKPLLHLCPICLRCHYRGFPLRAHNGCVVCGGAWRPAAKGRERENERTSPPACDRERTSQKNKGSTDDLRVCVCGLLDGSRTNRPPS